MELLILLVGLLCLAAGIKLGAKFHYYDNLKKRNKDLRAQIAKRRHTYATADGLEDALAVTIDLLLRQDAADKYRRARVAQLNSILGEVRKGPLSYDGDRPADRPPENGDM
ncbi:hypothetical protein LCGC14_0401360 [marine sediment metagenome]|uniref:Uncharacterized protein n=1 Tax=marine sediment metagenome TaxID=412755 RepID=A0A0F9W5Y9_9ZZZZ